MEGRLGPQLQGVIDSDQFAQVVGALAKVRRELESQAARSTRRFLHALNLPAGTDVSRLLAEIGELKRQVRHLTQQLEAQQFGQAHGGNAHGRAGG
jgi:polyhydroxyalkanoate synthesis regulator phasin